MSTFDKEAHQIMASLSPRAQEIFKKKLAAVKYEDYVEDKKKKGEKPLDKDAWERKVKGVANRKDNNANKLMNIKSQLFKHVNDLKEAVFYGLDKDVDAAVKKVCETHQEVLSARKKK